MHFCSIADASAIVNYVFAPEELITIRLRALASERNTFAPLSSLGGVICVAQVYRPASACACISASDHYVP